MHEAPSGVVPGLTLSTHYPDSDETTNDQHQMIAVGQFAHSRSSWT